MMRNFILLLAMLALTLDSQAQEQKFSPEKFDADMAAFVTREANFTPQEAEKFFPLFKEMHQQMRTVYGRIRTVTKQKPADDEACAAAIKECDKLNLELKKIEQTYHQKMLKVVSATKVYEAIKAEARFHRQMMKGWQHHGKKPNGQQRGKRR